MNINWWINRPSAVRRRLAVRAEVYARHGLTDDEATRLARYNTDRHYGVAFEPAYVKRMATAQTRFDRAWADLRDAVRRRR